MSNVSGRARALASATVAQNCFQGITASMAPKASCFWSCAATRAAPTRAKRRTFSLMARASAWKARACRPSVLRNRAADQAVKHLDGPVGQAGSQVEAEGGQCRVSALPLVVGEMLDRDAAGLTNKLGQACLMDPLATTGVDADRAHVRQAF